MTVERDSAEEARRAEARVQRWNESVREVRELCRQWQRDNNARLGPFCNPVEDEESSKPDNAGEHSKNEGLNFRA